MHACEVVVSAVSRCIIFLFNLSRFDRTTVQLYTIVRRLHWAHEPKRTSLNVNDIILYTHTDSTKNSRNLAGETAPLFRTLRIGTEQVAEILLAQLSLGADLVQELIHHVRIDRMALLLEEFEKGIARDARTGSEGVAAAEQREALREAQIVAA